MNIKKFMGYALFILGPCAVFQPLAMDIFISGLPRMMDDLRLSEQSIQYLLIIYMVASSIPQLIMGSLSDRYGRKNLMLSGAIGFFISSYLCTTTHMLLLLIGFRFIQGLSAATCLVVSYAAIRDLYHDDQSNAMSKMYSYLSCILALTAMFAPLTGTVIMDYFNRWEASFEILALYGIVALVIILAFMPETIQQKSNNTQLINRKAMKTVLSSRSFWRYVLSPTTSMTILYLYFSIGSILLMDVLKLSSYGFSVVFGINACFYLAGNYLASILLNRFSIRQVVVLGNLLAMSGTFLMMFLNQSFGLCISFIVICNLIANFGGGLMTGPATSASLGPFEECSGTASGVLGAIQYGIPACIGYFTTRFALNTTIPLALPVFLLSILNLWLMKRAKKQEIEFGIC